MAVFANKNKLRRAKAIERGLKMVPILIHLPPPSSDTAAGNRDVREVMREKTAQAEVLYNLIAGTATEGFQSNFYGQRHIAMELVASGGVVHFYAAVPVALVSVVKKAVLTAYPGARLEEVEDHNIFNQEGRLAATMGGEMVLRAESAYPIATYDKLERDPMEALLTTFSALGVKDGVAIQLMIRPAAPDWIKRSIELADAKRKGRTTGLSFSAQDLVKAAIKAPSARHEEEKANGSGPEVSSLELGIVEAIEEKTKQPGFETLIRVMVSTESVARSQQLLRDISTAFALFDRPGLNGYKFLPAVDVQGLVTAFIFRFFPIEIASNVLNSAELATLFHLPDSQFTPSSSVARQQSKQVDGPVQLPTVGLLFGYNEFRGVRKEIRLDNEDRRRHTYILGQTGTGKSTMLENLAVQDMVNGQGFAFIDPHGDSAEKLLGMVPKERSEDVIYFNPADTEYPLGLNLFEFNDPTQKDFIVQETINMLYKLYDPGHTGIIGPRYEHWYRNAALTLMSDPNGATFIEVPKVFTDTDYLKRKFRYLRDPTVIDFWTKEMGQTSDYHKSEMLGWFVSKFGAFVNNEMMRNIIGQTKSSFNLREVMDRKKILIVNLSKGRLGELNSQLLGMIFVIKFQAAAMSRAELAEDQRSDFALYVDEFQNFSTDSFASILSEARKYRLNLIVANQFIGQLRPEIRDAVFGNIGTIVAHRMGPEDAEFMVKQFAPVFEVTDLVNLPNYNAAMRLMIGGLPSQPFSMRDSAPLGRSNVELGMAVQQLSAAKFGRGKAVVEAEILERLAPGDVAPVAPGPGAATAAPGIGPVTAPPPAPVSASAPAPPIMPAMVAPPAPMPATVPVSAPAPAPMTAAMPMAAAPGVAMTPALVPTAPPPMPIPGAMPTAASAAASMLVPAVAPTPASPASVPVAAPPAMGMSPMGMGAMPAPMMGAMPAGMPLPMPAAAPASAPIPAPMPMTTMAAAPVPGFDAVPPVSSPTPVPAAALQGMASAPPPIGAPPVDLPGSAPVAVPAAPVMTMSNPLATSVPAPAASAPGAAMPVPVAMPPGPSDPTTLSLRDITGGKPLPSVQSPAAINPADVPLVPLGAEPPMPMSAQPLAPALDAPAEPVSQVVQQAPLQPELGSGQPLEDDPYANIEILGDLTPPLPAAIDQTMASDDAAASVAAGRPLPGDPYAGIDVMAATTAPPLAQEGMQRSGAARLDAGQQAMPERELELARVDEVAGPLASAAPPVEPTAAMEESVPAESMIHFVDPAAEKLLAQPDGMAGTAADDDSQRQMMVGLPEGVTFVNEPPSPEPPAQPAPVSEAPAAAPPLAPAAPVAVAPPLPQTPAPSAPPPSSAPVIMGGSGVTALAAPLDNMAVAPPPIGAPPVDLPASVAVPTDAPVPTSPPAVAAPAVANSAVVPESNVSLAEALEKSPRPSAEPAPPAPVSVAEVAAAAPLAAVAEVDKALGGLESVAQMLEEAKAAGPVPEPVAPSAPAVEATPVAMGPVQLERQEAAAPQSLVANQIEKAESEIDNLLSTSLIRDNELAKSRSLPQPVAALPAESNQGGLATGLNAAGSQSPATAGPAVSPKPAPAPELPETAQNKQQAATTVVAPSPVVAPPLPQPMPQSQPVAVQQVSPTTAVTSAPAPVPVVAPIPAPVVAPRPAPVPLPAPVSASVVQPTPVVQPVSVPQSQPQQQSQPQRPQPPAVIVKHRGEMLGVPPASQLEAVSVDDEAGLPQAESLAADEVARARAEHEAQVKLHPETLEPQPPQQAGQRPDSSASKRKHGKRRHRGGNSGERVESEAEAEHNKPTEAEAEAGALTGKLIMPTGEKPAEQPVQPTMEKPKKLAPGEVYVDEHGNVMVGD